MLVFQWESFRFDPDKIPDNSATFELDHSLNSRVSEHTINYQVGMSFKDTQSKLVIRKTIRTKESVVQFRTAKASSKLWYIL